MDYESEASLAISRAIADSGTISGLVKTDSAVGGSCSTAANESTLNGQDVAAEKTEFGVLRYFDVKHPDWKLGPQPTTVAKMAVLRDRSRGVEVVPKAELLLPQPVRGPGLSPGTLRRLCAGKGLRGGELDVLKKQFNDFRVSRDVSGNDAEWKRYHKMMKDTSKQIDAFRSVRYGAKRKKNKKNKKGEV